MPRVKYSYVFMLCISYVLPVPNCDLQYKTFSPSGLSAEALGIFFADGHFLTDEGFIRFSKCLREPLRFVARAPASSTFVSKPLILHVCLCHLASVSHNNKRFIESSKPYRKITRNRRQLQKDDLARRRPHRKSPL